MKIVLRFKHKVKMKLSIENNIYEQKIYELENKIETLQSQLDLYQ